MTQDACLFDIMELPEDSLRKLLLKIPSRMITRLLTAYPRAMGRLILELLTQMLRPETLDFLHDQINNSSHPSLSQIREAEREFLRIVNEENLLPCRINLN